MSGYTVGTGMRTMREQEDEEEDEEDVLRTEREPRGRMDRSRPVFVLQDVIARARRAHAILSRPESTEIDRRAVLFTARPPAPDASSSSSSSLSRRISR